MSADKTIYLTRKISYEEFIEIFRILNMDISRLLWGYSTELDVSIEDDELHLHYAYWGNEHARNRRRRTKQIIRELKKRNLVKKIGRWSY